MLRPGNTGFSKGRQWWLGEILLGLGKLLLQVDELLLEAGDLLMAFAQLLKRIHQSVVIDRREWLHLVAAALRRL